MLLTPAKLATQCSQPSPVYLIVVAGFLAGGVLDLRAGETKLGVVAIGLGVINAVIFFWR